MNYKNHATIKNTNNEKIDIYFNEGYSDNNYEIFDIELCAQDIGKFILDNKIKTLNNIKDNYAIEEHIHDCINDYIDDLVKHLYNEVEEYIYNNINE